MSTPMSRGLTRVCVCVCAGNQEAHWGSPSPTKTPVLRFLSRGGENSTLGPQSVFALVLTLSTTRKTIPKSTLVDRQKSGNPAREGRLAYGRNPPVLRDPPDTLKSDASPMQRRACTLCIQRCSKKLSAKLCQAMGSDLKDSAPQAKIGVCIPAAPPPSTGLELGTGPLCPRPVADAGLGPAARLRATQEELQASVCLLIAALSRPGRRCEALVLRGRPHADQAQTQGPGQQRALQRPSWRCAGADKREQRAQTL